jgi:hypothetical protein
VRQEGEALKIHLRELMAPWTFEAKFSYDTQFLFGSLMFTVGEDGTHVLLTRGPTPGHLQPIYGMSSYYLADPWTSSASNDVCSGLNPYVESYYLTAMMPQGYPIGTPIIHPQAGTLGFVSSAASADQDSIEDYPETKGNVS